MFHDEAKSPSTGRQKRNLSKYDIQIVTLTLCTYHLISKAGLINSPLSLIITDDLPVDLSYVRIIPVSRASFCAAGRSVNITEVVLVDDNTQVPFALRAFVKGCHGHNLSDRVRRGRLNVVASDGSAAAFAGK